MVRVTNFSNTTDRDFYGYGPEPPDPHWPDNSRVAVSFVVNCEEGAELSIADGDERNEAEYEEILEVRDAPDLCMQSHFDYGTRVGYWRIMSVLETFGVPATINACARSIERSPWIGKNAIARGHEIACHGYRWEGPVHMSKSRERELILRSIETLQNATGVRPVGWHCRSSSSVNTRRLLVEEGGFLYDSDAYCDDLPFVVKVNDRPHIILPYAFDTNDMRFFQPNGFLHADDFSTYCIDAFDWLWREGAHSPRMITIGLHLRIIGRPGRISGLESLLHHMVKTGGVWFARRREIAQHWANLSTMRLPSSTA